MTPGLRLVRFIRDELGNRAMRVILRTGQPGYAPEIDTIQLYDINDYKTKSELTRVRLFTSLTVAIRSYWQIHQLEASRRGLALIVGAGNELSKPRGLQRFAEGVVTQLCALLGIGEEGLVCAVDGDFGRSPTVLAAAGCYAGWMGRSLDDISDRRVREELEKAFSGRSHQFGEATCLYFGGTGNQALAAFVDVQHPLSTLDRNLLEVFCSNISVGFENMQLYRRISNLAFEDGLVKLPNRNSLLTLIDQRPSAADTLALVDIDGFADITAFWTKVLAMPCWLLWQQGCARCFRPRWWLPALVAMFSACLARRQRLRRKASHTFSRRLSRSTQKTCDFRPPQAWSI